MKAIWIFCAAAAFAQTPVRPPAAITPEDAPLPARRSTGAHSELEGISSSESGVMSQAKYEGGTVTFKPGSLMTYVNEKEIVVVQSKLRFAIPVQAITEISYGKGVQDRVGAAVGTPAVAINAKDQAATGAGIVWKAESKTKGMAFKIDKGDFDKFMAALQNVTGKQAINTDAGK